jgi:hypothetical protein
VADHPLYQWTKRGYDQIISHDDKLIAIVSLQMLKELGAFDDWPEFLLEQELERADQELKRIPQQPTDTDTLALRGLWRCVYDVVERSYASHMHFK